MCGIFGLIANSRSELTEDIFKCALPRLVKLSEVRGHEATGIAVASNNKITVYKQAMKPSTMLKSAEFNKFINSCFSSNRIVEPIAAIGHTRLVTSGSQVIPDNNQPINTNNIVGVHNGIIANDKDLLNRYPSLGELSHVYSSSDTKIFFGLIDKYYEEDDDIITAVFKSYKEILGSASIALFCNNLPVLILATNTGSLYYWFNEEHGFFVFGSERHIVKRFLQKSGLPQTWNFKTIRWLNPFSGAVIKFEDIIPKFFYLKKPIDRQELICSTKKKEPGKIIDVSSTHKILRRCTKCILPETYPLISFDENGVCNYCRRYEKQKFHGRAALEAILEKYRSKNGEPDCIVGFSGGRDSSYALHVLKNEFGMHPIAYTYDWALVTDLARRNQARVTGKLGIEHIIRAADIHTKRRHIRKNIYAWLRKPELGMVPLFMAGDKLFYYYGRQLRKETGVKLTVLAIGYQFEHMEFKVNFCGIDQNLANSPKLYNYDFFVKVRLALWYIKQYLLNPAYLNESLLDNIFAFYATFINKDDYIYLYHYIPWDEKLIERTLKEGYGWEAEEKYGKNQWRMGDGQTAIINYIYYTIAGFSEFDNFRSYQIRDGLITRGEALKLVQEDNKPRLEMLREFCQMIGFDLEELLLKINAIPKLY